MIPFLGRTGPHDNKGRVYPLERKLHFKQHLKADLDRVWNFFTDEKNLEILTPDFLNFNVLGKSTETIKEGTLINYKLKLRGIPIGWQTKIEVWEPKSKFVDRQLKGPYKLWHHTHRFTSDKKGVLVEDIIRYDLYFSRISQPLIGWYVKKDVEKIFTFRQEKMREIFGS